MKQWRTILFGASCLFALSASAAEPNAFFGRPIRGIEYSPPAILHPEDLKRVQVLKPGDALTEEDTAEAIDRLFATGMFEDIAIDVQPSADGVVVRFLTEP